VELHLYSLYMPSCRGEEELYFYEYISLNAYLTTLSAAQTTDLGMASGGKRLW